MNFNYKIIESPCSFCSQEFILEKTIGFDQLFNDEKKSSKIQSILVEASEDTKLCIELMGLNICAHHLCEMLMKLVGELDK